MLFKSLYICAVHMPVPNYLLHQKLIEFEKYRHWKKGYIEMVFMFLKYR